jgi:hypothetical protein
MSTLAATTTPAAATHSHSVAGLIAVAVLALVIVTAGYLATCWLFPFTTCRHHNPRSSWRCRRCEGTGHRLRTGRRLLNHLRAAHRAGQRASDGINHRADRHH